MRVLVLSQYYDPEPVPKPGELAKALADRGHAVTVLTGFPNYPSGKLYAGFRLGAIKQEQLGGIQVIRAFEFPYHGKRVLGRVLNYLSFMISAPLASLVVPPCDVIYVWHPPLTIGVAAWLIARLRGVPFVYDVQDIWPEIALLSGLLTRGWLVTLMAKLERFVYRRADYLLVVTADARANLISKGVSPALISVVPHWVDESMFKPGNEDLRSRMRKQYGWEHRFVVLFAGNIGMVQGLDSVVMAAHQLRNGKKILIVLVGEGTDKARLQGLAEKLDAQDAIQFLEHQPIEKIADFMAAADALLVHLKKTELSRYVIPTKTIAYLAAGKPILMAMDGAAATLVSAAGAGLVIPSEDPVALARAIETLWSMPRDALLTMGRHGRDYFEAHLAKERAIDQYEEILRRSSDKVVPRNVSHPARRDRKHSADQGY